MTAVDWAAPVKKWAATSGQCDTPLAFIEPSEHIARRDVPEACVITFFGDVVDRLVERRGARILVENRWEDGPLVAER